jgi:dTMP kinase
MAYIVLDGPDGGGKSTQAALLCASFERAGKKVLHLREPGSTPVGEALRSLLLDPRTGDLLPLTEALLFTAARAELVARVIAPALAEGCIVVAERCFASTLAYQCAPETAAAAAGGVDEGLVFELTRRAHGPHVPDLVAVLDVDVETSLQRRRSRSDDRFEQRERAFHERVRAAYLRSARRDPCYVVVDAMRPTEAVHQELLALVERRLS